ncbi:MAG: hypothetical protein JRI55_08215, partial [Deltaproteobacteria bacterium]|nr:hypothetical protein [Deltaproteobacteria bacterium]
MSEPGGRLAALAARADELLWRPRPPALLLLVAAGIGCLLVTVLFDLDFVLGTADYWLSTGETPGAIRAADRSSPLTGLLYFVQEPWGWPLFTIRGLGHPEGANVIFTDSVPLLALFAKLLRLPAGTHYQGWWIAACYVLQAVAASGLVQALGQRNLITTVSAALLALSLPSFLARLGHAALCGHFLLLAALALYFLAAAGRRLRPVLVAYAALLFVALHVHFYLLAMTAGLFLATLARSVASGGLRWPFAAAWLGGAVLGMLALMIVGGYFAPGAPTMTPGGFGHYSMNLLSPVAPVYSGVLPVLDGPIDATGGQRLEGYHYLGAGLLVLLLVAVISAWREALEALRRHWALAAVATAMLLFALSSEVYVGQARLLVISLPEGLDRLVSQLRSSGRFFWPVGYLALAAALILPARALGRPVGTLVLLGAVAVQLMDAGPLREYVARVSRTVEPELLADGPLEQLVAEHDAVFVYPPALCDPGPIHRQCNTELQRMAARYAVPINSVYGARRPDVCEREAERLERLEVGPGELHVILYESL